MQFGELLTNRSSHILEWITSIKMSCLFYLPFFRLVKKFLIAFINWNSFTTIWSYFPAFQSIDFTEMVNVIRHTHIYLYGFSMKNVNSSLFNANYSNIERMNKHTHKCARKIDKFHFRVPCLNALLQYHKTELHCQSGVCVCEFFIIVFTFNHSFIYRKHAHCTFNSPSDVLCIT